MRILHVSSDDITGGAARCAYRLHRGLLGLHVDSRMLVKRRRSSDPTVAMFQPPDGIMNRSRRRFRSARIRASRRRYRGTIDSEVEAFSDVRSPFAGALADYLRDADVVHLHWVSGFVDLESLFAEVPATARVVWTLHDMNALTGGCHYVDGCEGFLNRCGACPQLGSVVEEDLSRSIWKRKRKLFERLSPSRLHVVTPSKWLAGEIQRSSVFGERFGVEVIPYGVDTEEFAPRDRDASRAALGVPAGAKVVLFAAHSVTNRRKGLDLLSAALLALRDVEGLFFLSLGGGAPISLEAIPHRHLGYTGDDRLLSLVYSAADLFVLPSREDNLPATGLEAVASGTPVVAFDVGGIPEMVRPGITGELAEPASPTALALALRRVLGDETLLENLRAQCRAVALREYSLLEQARRYRSLYERLCSTGQKVESLSCQPQLL